MNTARSLVRFAVAGLFVNFLAVACVVSDGGDDDDDNIACDPGSFKACDCADGTESTKKCNASGSGYGACACDGGGEGGGAGTGGSGGTGGTGGTAGSGNNAGGGGETNEGGAGAGSGGAAGETSVGGAGGSGGVGADELCIEEEHDDCQDCIQRGCCDEWVACFNDTEGDCAQEVFDFTACTDLKRNDAALEPGDVLEQSDVADCAAQVGGGSGPWSAGLLPTTKAVVDCIGGGEGWANQSEWSDDSCDVFCFMKPIP